MLKNGLANVPRSTYVNAVDECPAGCLFSCVSFFPCFGTFFSTALCFPGSAWTAMGPFRKHKRGSALELIPFKSAEKRNNNWRLKAELIGASNRAPFEIQNGNDSHQPGSKQSPGARLGSEPDEVLRYPAG